MGVWCLLVVLGGSDWEVGEFDESLYLLSFSLVEGVFEVFFSRAEKNQKAMGASEIRGDGLPTSGGSAELASLRHRRPCLRPYGAPA